MKLQPIASHLRGVTRVTHRPLSFIKLTFFFSFFIFFGINTITQFGIATGSHIILLLWTFWTMCLPFFGGGLLLAPLLEPFIALSDYTLEACAWLLAIGINAYACLFMPEIYHLTPITHLLYWIVTHPFPYWIIFVCATLPVAASWLHERYKLPVSTVLYTYLQTGLVVLSFACLGYLTISDLIILSNIHG